MVELKKTRRIYAMKVIKKALVTDDEVGTGVFFGVTIMRDERVRSVLELLGPI